jgi:hypothetical protein
MSHPHTVAIHQEATSAHLTADSLESAITLLRATLALVHADGESGFGTVRSSSGILIVAMDSNGDMWDEASMTPARIAAL